MEFLNAEWTPFVISAAIILLLVFVWKEWRTTAGRRLVWSILLAVICISSLVMLALKPALPQLSPGNTFIILTRNYQQTKLDSLKAIYPQAERINYNGTGNLFQLDAAAKVFVLGSGLRPYDLHKITAQNNTVFIPGEIPEGILQMRFTKEVSLGDSIRIRGLYNVPVPGNRLVLEDFSGSLLDSLEFSGTAAIDFEFNARAGVAGNYLYNLILKDSTQKVLSSEALPITIKDRGSIKILILNSYPLFETKYLKEFLGREGNEISIKTRISRDRFKYEFINSESRTLGSLTADLLENYDLLIVDSNYLISLDSRRLNILKEVIQTEGLGVFIQPAEDFFTGRQELTRFDFYADQEPVNLGFKTSSKPAKHDYLFSSQESMVPVIEFDESLYAAYKLVGSGKIGSWVFEDIYELVLKGEVHTYEYLWSKMINRLAGKESIPAEWQIEGFPVYKNEPVAFDLRTQISKPFVQTEYNSAVPLAMRPEIPDLWRGVVYPNNTGWNRLSFINDSLSGADYYVFEDNSWETLNDYRTRKANLKHFSISQKNEVPFQNLKPINRLWFFIVFLISSFGLWLIPKLG